MTDVAAPSGGEVPAPRPPGPGPDATGPDAAGPDSAQPEATGHDTVGLDTAGLAAAGLAAPGRVAASERLRPARHLVALDRLADLAAGLLGVEAAQVSLVSGVQHVAGGAGKALPAVGTEGPAEDSLCTVTVGAGVPLVVPAAAGDDRVRHLPPVATGAVGAYLGVPLTAADGHVVGALCVFDAQARSWTDADVALLSQLGAAVVTELELSAVLGEYAGDQVRLELAVGAARIGTWQWDLATGAVRGDERALAMFGDDATTFGGTLGEFTRKVHADDRARVQAAIDTAVATCGEYEVEFRVVLPDGRMRWLQARGRALASEDGAAARVLGAVYETTRERDADARVARVLEAMPAGFCSLDGDWRATHVNAEAERLLGRPRAALLGARLWDAVPALAGSGLEEALRTAADAARPVEAEVGSPHPAGRWLELRAWPTADGVSLSLLDVTERHRAAQAAERANARVALLARVTAELTRTLDAAEAAAGLPRLVVPALGDGCVVTLVDDAGRARDVGSWHADPAARAALERYVAVRVGAMPAGAPVYEALRTGRPQQITLARAGALLAPGPGRERLAEFAPARALALPLRGRDQVLGVLTLYTTADVEPDPDAVAAAREVADRAGLALDNARLYGRQRQVAETLQRSLLTDPPRLEDAEIAVRYLPAARTASVGGDWYDAFVQPGGTPVLVIGDVAGHDTAAAAAMGALRGLLRGVATYSDAGPAEVLRGLDAAMATLHTGTMATAAVARLERGGDGRTRMRWASAGHPPPVVATPEGTVATLGGRRGDLLLGVDPAARRGESTAVLAPGSTLLLFTDGLVERRDSDLVAGYDRLERTLADLAGLPLEQLCDELLDRLVDPHPADDVALVALRLSR